MLEPIEFARFNAKLGEHDTMLDKLEDDLEKVEKRSDKDGLRLESLENSRDDGEEQLKCMNVSVTKIETALIGDLNTKGMISEHREMREDIKEIKQGKKDWWIWIERALFSGLIGIGYYLVKGLLAKIGG